MAMRIKNWKKFQHFKDRKPPWIKLYRDLLDDPDWHDLDGDSAKALMALWLVASESDGELPSLKKLAFRLRIAEKQLSQLLNNLSHWLEQDDITTISRRYQVDAPETETETETQVKTETELRSLRSLDLKPSDDWPEDYREEFWKQYPRRVGRKSAFTKLAIIRKSGEVTFATLMAGVARIPVNDPKFIPHPSTWLNQGRWDDEVLPLNGAKNETATAGDRAREFARRIREVERAEGFGRPPDVFGSDGNSSETVRPVPQLQKLA